MWTDLPIVAVTSYAMNGDEERALKAGCIGYVTKPIDTHRFPELGAEVIYNRPSGQSAVSAEP